MFQNEEWRVIEDFPKYAVSDCGRIKHVESGGIRKVATNARGFLIIALYGDDSQTRYLRQVNTLVAHAFLEPPSDFNRFDRWSTPSVWHIDGDLTNCRADNLRWEERRKVIEWNDMHRRGESKFTPTKARVKNNRTGAIYDSTYDCALAEGVLESDIIWAIEKQALHIRDDTAHYRYLLNGDE